MLICGILKSEALEMLKFTVKADGFSELDEKLAQACTKAEHILAVQVQKDTSPYVPFLTGSLDQRTKVVGNAIIYPDPYARYLYYGKVMVDSQTGKGPAHYVDKKGNEQIRFRKGAVLRATDKDLVFNKAGHAQAQSHWFEASKAENLEKWVRVADKAVKNGL